MDLGPGSLLYILDKIWAAGACQRPDIYPQIVFFCYGKIRFDIFSIFFVVAISSYAQGAFACARSMVGRRREGRDRATPFYKSLD